MKKLTEKKYIYFLTFLCALIYFTSYISRINFGAVLLDIVRTEGFLKSEISLAVTGSFITYGVGQLISGYLCDRFSPKYILFIGLLTTAFINFLIPFCPNATYMVVIWSINGFAQALMWPPISKILATLLTPQSFRGATTKVAWGSSFGTMAVYIITPVCISVASWKSVFFIATFLCIIISAIWLICCTKIESHAVEQIPTEQKTTSAPGAPSFSDAPPLSVVIPLLSVVMIVLACQGALKDSVTTWMPSFIGETFNLGSSVSILTGVILPIFSIASYQLASWIYGKKVKNELTCTAIFFALCLISSALLIITSERMASLSVLCFAVLSGATHGVNLMLTCMIVPYFKKAGTMTGVLNSCGYLGSALSTYGIALVSEKFGWSATIIVWTLIALAGTVLSFMVAKKWGKTYTFAKK